MDIKRLSIEDLGPHLEKSLKLISTIAARHNKIKKFIKAQRIEQELLVQNYKLLVKMHLVEKAISTIREV